MSSLNNQHVSRHHAKLVKTADGYLLQDLGKTHGTFVNESRVEDAHSETRRQNFPRQGSYRSALFDRRSETRQRLQKRTPLRFSNALWWTWASSFLPARPIWKRFPYILDFQYQWEQSFTPDAAFQKILESALKISGAERGFILVREGETFGYAAGTGRARPEPFALAFQDQSYRRARTSSRKARRYTWSKDSTTGTRAGQYCQR